MTKVALSGVMVAVLTSSCTVKDPLYCELPDHPCTDPSRPICDVNGQFDESDHIKNTCIPTPANCPPGICGCTPGAFLSCDSAGATENVCGADGMSVAQVSCANGCDSALAGCKCSAGDTLCVNGSLETCQLSGGFGSPAICALGCASDGVRCTDISASNGLNAALDASGTREDFTLNDGATIDTGSGLVFDPVNGTVAIPSIVITQSDGPSIRAFYVKSIVLHGTAIRGTNALAIVADAGIAVEGTVAARAVAVTGGPGAVTTSACDGTTATLAVNGVGQEYGAGAGGGGGGTAGAFGGGFGATGSKGYPGGAPAGPTTIEPLVGGCSGGAVNDQSGTLANPPGAGGGAIQLVARGSISIDRNGTATGLIDVGGAGGQGMGAGGGGGGQVLLEAPGVTVDGVGVGIYANGGAGGACNLVGADSNASLQAAIGPACSPHGGGNGGTGLNAPTDGELFLCSTCPTNFRQGGGGGAAGRLRVNTANGTFSVTNSAVISAQTSIGTLGTR